MNCCPSKRNKVSQAKLLACLDGYEISVARDVSLDGTAVIGNALRVGDESREQQAFRWTESTGMVGLIEDDTLNSLALEVSQDGRVVVGTVWDRAGGNHRLFHWTESGETSFIEPLEGYSNSLMYDVTKDGSAIVGINYGIGDRSTGFYWSETTGIRKLEALDPDQNGTRYFNSSASAVSEDGLVVIGSSWGTSYRVQAFRWSLSEGMRGLGFLDGGFNSEEVGMSSDGSVIIGNADSARVREGTYEAFRWTEKDGMETVVAWLQKQGVAMEESLLLLDASYISEDGNVIVGDRSYSSAEGQSGLWLARGTSGTITLEEFTQTFGTTASVQQTALTLPASMMNGAHHNLLLSRNFIDQEHMVWIGGDFATDSRRDADLWMSEAGIAYDLKPGLRGGIGIGYSALDQELSYAGSYELEGRFLVAELDYQLPDFGVILSLTGIYGDWDAAIRRGYTNGGAPDASKGSTDLRTYSIRLRVDWVDLFDFAGFNFTPRAAFTHTNIHSDAYTETDGGFPVAFDSMSHDALEIRVGLTADHELTEKTSLSLILEGVYRMDEDSAGFSGEVIGLFDFSIPGSKNEQEWMRGGVELSHRLRNNMLLTATLFGSTQGEDPQVSSALNFQFFF